MTAIDFQSFMQIAPLIPTSPCFWTSAKSGGTGVPPVFFQTARARRPCPLSEPKVCQQRDAGMRGGFVRGMDPNTPPGLDVPDDQQKSVAVFIKHPNPHWLVDGPTDNLSQTLGQALSELGGRLTVLFDMAFARHFEPPARTSHDLAHPTFGQRLARALLDPARASRACRKAPLSNLARNSRKTAPCTTGVRAPPQPRLSKASTPPATSLSR